MPETGYRITELEAAIGVAQLERRAELVAARARNAEVLAEGLNGLQQEGLLQLPSAPQHVCHPHAV